MLATEQHTETPPGVCVVCVWFVCDIVYCVCRVYIVCVHYIVCVYTTPWGGGMRICNTQYMYASLTHLCIICGICLETLFVAV